MLLHNDAVPGPFFLLLPFLCIVCLLSEGKTRALLPNGGSSAMPRQHAVHAQMRVLCVIEELL